MELELPYGPWKRLSFGEWGGYPSGIYVNQEKLLLLALFERHGEEVSGVLTILKKAFLTTADLSKAAQAQRREMTVIEKHSQEGSLRYVLVSSNPAYSRYSQQALVETLGKQVNELKAISKTVEELAEAYNTAATDLAQADEEEVQALFGDPFLLFALLNPQAPQTRETPSKEQRVPIGATAGGELVSIPLPSLAKAVVVGGTPRQRLHAVHVLCEAALTNSIPCVVFDSTDAFAGLAQPNKNSKDFTRFRMTATPLGFPFKDYKLGKGFYVDLALVDGKLFLNVLGLSGTRAGDVIENAWTGAEKHALSDLIDKVAGQAGEKDFTSYEVSKAGRALRVVEKVFPSIFAKLVETDLLVPWHEGIGRVFHVNATGFGDAAQHLAVSSLLAAFPKQKNRALKAVIAFESDLTRVYGDVLQLVEGAGENGIGFVLHAEHELDVQLVEKPSLKLELLESGEAVATVAGEKPVRFSLRPSYTACTELEAKATA